MNVYCLLLRDDRIKYVTILCTYSADDTLDTSNPVVAAMLQAVEAVQTGLCAESMYFMHNVY